MAAASYWTVGAVAAAVMALHAYWLTRSTHTGEVVSGFGAAMVVLGVWVASRPYVRLGIEGLIQQGLPQDDAGYIVGDNYLEELAAIQQAARPSVALDVWAERVVAVVVIVVGTLLNGYGTPLVRWLGWSI